MATVASPSPSFELRREKIERIKMASSEREKGLRASRDKLVVVDAVAAGGGR